jgi:streptogramin lyase
VAIDPLDETKLYIAAWHNSRLNIVDTVASTMTWYAGTGGRFYGSGLDPTTALLPPEEKVFTRNLAVMDLPSSVAFDANGDLYFSDQANHMIRRIKAGTDKLEVVVGMIVIDINPDTGLPAAGPASIHRQPGFQGDGGPATAAKLHGHTDQKADPGSRIVMDDANHRLLITDTVNGVIRAYDIDTGNIDTIIGKYESAGTMNIIDAISGEAYTADAGSVAGYSGDGGDPLQAVFNTPRDIAIGIDGEIYVADTKNHCVRVVKDGIVNTFAGHCNPDPAAAGYSGDYGPAVDADFTDTFGVEVDAEGNVYIADSGNQIIRRVKH